MRFTTNHGIYIIILVFTAIALALVVFVVSPALQYILQSSADILSNNSRIASADSESRELADFKQKYPGYQANLEKINQLFVDPENPIAFIQFLENSAASSHIVSDINLVPDKKTNVQGQKISGFEILAKGSFADMVQFSWRLETGPYLISLQSLSIKKPEQESDDNQKRAAYEAEGKFIIEALTK